jgi:hypothetical protein
MRTELEFFFNSHDSSQVVAVFPGFLDSSTNDNFEDRDGSASRSRPKESKVIALLSVIAKT